MAGNTRVTGVSSERTGLPSPVDGDRLNALLHGYHGESRTFLVEGFTRGFAIPSTKTPQSRLSKNLKSAEEFPQAVREKIEKELEAGRLEGPYSCSPYQSFICSPIGVVPKKSGAFRMIHHLSHPLKDSVNSNIPPELCSVSYATTDDAVNLILKAGTDCFMAKSDILEAFRILPVSPAHYHLLGLHFQGSLFFDKCLPMGCSISCSYFEKFSTAIQWMAQRHCGIPLMTHVLDDFFIVGKSFEETLGHLDAFQRLCSFLGIPLSPEKTEGPSSTLTFLGIELDARAMEVRLPADKIRKSQEMIQEILQSRKVTLRHLQSLIGTLSFACRVVQPGRPFLRRLIDLTIGAKAPHHLVKITRWAKLDLLAWQTFLSDFNGARMIQKSVWENQDDLHLHTDASGSLGFGAFFNYKWFSGEWPKKWQSENITLLELFPIVLSVNIWGEDLANKFVIFHSDNMAVVAVINKLSSREPKVMSLVRSLVVMSMAKNISFKAEHVLGARNESADALSRLQLGRFRKLHPFADLTPTPIPTHLQPANWRFN